MLAPGQVLQGRYRIERLLQEGGMSTVYVAWDANLDARVAVKEMKGHFTSAQEKQLATEQFKQEAQMVARLNHHGLIRVTNFFEDGVTNYLVMDLIDGDSMERMINRYGKAVPWDLALYWMYEVAQVLDYLHTLKPQIIFRDLKPSNIMVTRTGHIKLIDFGISKLFDTETGGATRTIIRGAGTPGFAPPEQYGTSGKQRTDGRSDIYALGATWYTILTCTVPPEATDRWMNQVPMTPIKEISPDIPEGVVAMIEKMMALKPDDRYPSVKEMLPEMAALMPGGRPPIGDIAFPDGMMKPPSAEDTAPPSSDHTLMPQAMPTAGVAFPQQSAPTQFPAGMQYGTPSGGMPVPPGMQQGMYPPGYVYPPGTYPGYPPGVVPPGVVPGAMPPTQPGVMPGMPTQVGGAVIPPTPTQDRPRTAPPVMAILTVVLIVAAIGIGAFIMNPPRPNPSPTVAPSVALNTPGATPTPEPSVSVAPSVVPSPTPSVVAVTPSPTPVNVTGVLLKGNKTMQGAIVEVNGVPTAKFTNDTVRLELEPGRYKIVISKTGWSTLVLRDVPVVPNHLDPIPVKLSRTATLTLTGDPGTATIKIFTLDGKLVRELPPGPSATQPKVHTVKDLPPGTYKIVATAIGFKDKRINVDLEGGENKKLASRALYQELIPSAPVSTGGGDTGGYTGGGYTGGGSTGYVPVPGTSGGGTTGATPQ